MGYCTQKDLTSGKFTLEELIALTDDDQGLGEVVASVVDAAIAEADDTINGYIQDRYDVPFTTTPETIKFLSVAIAAFFIISRRGEENPGIFDAYTKALSKLKSISKGEFKIPGVALKDNTGIASTTPSNKKRTFTRTERDAAGNVLGDVGTTEKW
ncbi:MAG: DUF1320 domain-containing protein [Thermodesulfobacteriota bacterium]